MRGATPQKIKVHHTERATMDDITSWWGTAQKERYGQRKIRRQDPEPTPMDDPRIAPPGGITKPEPDPETGKTLRPGELLERQMRQYAQKEQPKPKLRKRRDYDAKIARALKDLGI